MNTDAPIGIFDSGIGGLTVAGAIQALMPDEQLIYFGDTAHFPYGEKSPEAIRNYSLRISAFLLHKGCKAILIACNSASSVAYTQVKKYVGNKALVVNVIDPICQYAATHYHQTRIGVIGTRATIKSEVYIKRIKKLNPALEVPSMATPLLAPMIEEGFFNHTISQTVIHSYLSGKHFQNLSALILGCTHYPLIKKEIREYYKKEVEIIDSANIVAHHLHRKLAENKLLHSGNQKTAHRFFVSDYTRSFEKSSHLFFGSAIHLVEEKLFH